MNRPSFVIRRRQGQILPLFAVFIGFLLGFSALAFDLGYAMIVRAHLVTALDAAALAAVRFAPDGAGAMSAAAERAFLANLAPGRLIASNPTISVPTITPDNGSLRVAFTGTVTVPTFFARWFGRNELTINATTEAARRDRNVILVLDYSGSVAPVIGDIREAAKAFVDSFSDTTDQVGLVLFSTAGRIEYAPRRPFKADLRAAIDSVQPEAWTNHAAGLYFAYRTLLELNDPLKDVKMNEIVFFTDGRANWFPGRFNVQIGPCTTSPVDGVFGGNPGGGYYGNRVLTLDAPPTPGRPPLTPDCPGWAEGTNQLLSIQSLWRPPASPTAGPIFADGIALAGFKNTNPPLTNPNLNGTRRREIAANVLDNLARSVRRDAVLRPRIHAIGYQGNEALELDVLERLANCGGCTRVAAADAGDSTQANGKFVMANNSNELMQAFLEIAGFIGRITQ